MDQIFTRIADRMAYWPDSRSPSCWRPTSSSSGQSAPSFHYSDTWQLVVNTSTTIITFLMVFLIQNSQDRDGATMQAKLDGSLRAVENACEQFIGIEHLTDKQIAKIRKVLKDDCGGQKDDAGGLTIAPHESVERLLKRY